MRSRAARLRISFTSLLNSHSRTAAPHHAQHARQPVQFPSSLHPTTSPASLTSIRTIKTIRKAGPRPISRFNQHPSLPQLGASPGARIKRQKDADTLPHRSGALAHKRGMTAVYDPSSGKRTPVTVLQMDRCQVIGHKIRDKHGYDAVVIGSGYGNPRSMGRAMLGVYASTQVRDEQGGKQGLSPKRDVREFKVRDTTGLRPAVGEVVHPSWFQVGQFVDTRSVTKGKGFAGVMKRHGMGGQPASHGVSLVHRSLGSAGGSQGSGSRVHPGKRMAGRMGGQRHTIQNLEVLIVDDENGIVVVNGCVSGPKGSLVMLSDAIKKDWPEIPSESVAPVPGAEAQGALREASTAAG